jgi:hypothetical protein
MTHGFKIAGFSLAVVVLGFGPAGAGGYKHSGTGSDIRSGTSTESKDDSATGVRGDAGTGLSGGAVTPGSPSTGGSLNTDTSVHGPGDPRLTHPDQPSASPRMDTEPSARDRMREREQWWPRSHHDPNQSDAQSPRSEPDGQSPRSQEKPSQPDAQSPRSDRSPSPPGQPLRSYKQ